MFAFHSTTFTTRVNFTYIISWEDLTNSFNNIHYLEFIIGYCWMKCQHIHLNNNDSTNLIHCFYHFCLSLSISYSMRLPCNSYNSDQKLPLVYRRVHIMIAHKLENSYKIVSTISNNFKHVSIWNQPAA